MKSVIVVGICEKRRKINNLKSSYSIGFVGLYKGYRINQIITYSQEIEDLIVNQEYILELEVLKLSNNRLETKLINFKPLKKICYVT